MAKKMANEAASLLFTLFASCRKAAIAKALHSKGAAFSSHLHKNKEALLVKSLHYIPLVKRSAALPVKLPPVGGSMRFFLLRFA